MALLYPVFCDFATPRLSVNWQIPRESHLTDLQDEKIIVIKCFGL